MKQCTQCEKENPSSANCCMYCGAILAEENLDETARLQMELNDANGTIALLKQSLATAQEQVTKYNSEATTEKTKYEKKIAELNQQCLNLIAQLAAASKQKKSKSRIVFMILSIVLFLVIIFQTIQIDDLQNSFNNAKKQITNLTNQNNKQQTEITNQKGQNNKQQTEITNLKELVPQKYRVTANRAKLYYKNCDKKNVHIDCIYHSGNIVNIYVIENGYGLSISGWIIMSDLTKQ